MGLGGPTWKKKMVVCFIDSQGYIRYISYKENGLQRLVGPLGTQEAVTDNSLSIEKHYKARAKKTLKKLGYL